MNILLFVFILSLIILWRFISFYHLFIGNSVILSDMIGLTKSIPNVYVYNDFFEWFQRRVYPIIDAIVKPATQMNILFPNETFSQRLLRLCERLTRNSMRTHLFDCSSPIPILLCRDVIEITKYFIHQFHFSYVHKFAVF